MNYFDDISFVHVSEALLAKDSDFDNVGNEWGFGIMTGEGCVKKRGLDPSIQLKMPFLYLVYPGNHSGWQSVNGATRHNRWFVVRGPRAERMVQAMMPFRKEGTPVIYLDNYQDLILIHRRMKHLYQCSIPSRSYQLARYAEEFIATIYDLLNMKGKDLPIFRYISNLVEKLSLHPEYSCDFYRMAKENHVSYDYFRRCFKEYTGLTIREFMNRKRLEYALRLLENSSGSSIKEITDQCGFPRQAEFARFIKLHTGMTPSEIRKHPRADA